MADEIEELDLFGFQGEYLEENMFKKAYLNEHIKQCFIGVFQSLQPFLIYSFCGAFSQRFIYMFCGKIL